MSRKFTLIKKLRLNNLTILQFFYKKKFNRLKNYNIYKNAFSNFK